MDKKGFRARDPAQLAECLSTAQSPEVVSSCNLERMSWRYREFKDSLSYRRLPQKEKGEGEPGGGKEEGGREEEGKRESDSSFPIHQHTPIAV